MDCPVAFPEATAPAGMFSPGHRELFLLNCALHGDSAAASLSPAGTRLRLDDVLEVQFKEVHVVLSLMLGPSSAYVEPSGGTVASVLHQAAQHSLLAVLGCALEAEKSGVRVYLSLLMPGMAVTERLGSTLIDHELVCVETLKKAQRQMNKRMDELPSRFRTASNEVWMSSNDFSAAVDDAIECIHGRSGVPSFIFVTDGSIDFRGQAAHLHAGNRIAAVDGTLHFVQPVRTPLGGPLGHMNDGNLLTCMASSMGGFAWCGGGDKQMEEMFMLGMSQSQSSNQTSSGGWVLLPETVCENSEWLNRAAKVSGSPLVKQLRRVIAHRTVWLGPTGSSYVKPSSSHPALVHPCIQRKLSRQKIERSRSFAEYVINVDLRLWMVLRRRLGFVLTGTRIVLSSGSKQLVGAEVGLMWHGDKDIMSTCVLKADGSGSATVKTIITGCRDTGSKDRSSSSGGSHRTSARSGHGSGGNEKSSKVTSDSGRISSNSAVGRDNSGGHHHHHSRGGGKAVDPFKVPFMDEAERYIQCLKIMDRILSKFCRLRFDQGQTDQIRSADSQYGLWAMIGSAPYGVLQTLLDAKVCYVVAPTHSSVFRQGSYGPPSWADTIIREFADGHVHTPSGLVAWKVCQQSSMRQELGLPLTNYHSLIVIKCASEGNTVEFIVGGFNVTPTFQEKQMQIIRALATTSQQQKRVEVPRQVALVCAPFVPVDSVLSSGSTASDAMSVVSGNTSVLESSEALLHVTQSIIQEALGVPPMYSSSAVLQAQTHFIACSPEQGASLCSLLSRQRASADLLVTQTALWNGPGCREVYVGTIGSLPTLSTPRGAANAVKTADPHANDSQQQRCVALEIRLTLTGVALSVTIVRPGSHSILQSNEGLDTMDSSENKAQSSSIQPHTLAKTICSELRSSDRKAFDGLRLASAVSTILTSNIGISRQQSGDSEASSSYPNYPCDVDDVSCLQYLLPSDLHASFEFEFLHDLTDVDWKDAEAVVSDLLEDSLTSVQPKASKLSSQVYVNLSAKSVCGEPIAFSSYVSRNYTSAGEAPVSIVDVSSDSSDSGQGPVKKCRLCINLQAAVVPITMAATFKPLSQCSPSLSAWVPSVQASASQNVPLSLPKQTVNENAGDGKSEVKVASNSQQQLITHVADTMASLQQAASITAVRFLSDRIDTISPDQLVGCLKKLKHFTVRFQIKGKFLQKSALSSFLPCSNLLSDFLLSGARLLETHSDFRLLASCSSNSFIGFEFVQTAEHPELKLCIWSDKGGLGIGEHAVEFGKASQRLSGAMPLDWLTIVARCESLLALGFLASLCEALSCSNKANTPEVSAEQTENILLAEPNTGSKAAYASQAQPIEETSQLTVMDISEQCKLLVSLSANCPQGAAFVSYSKPIMLVDPANTLELRNVWKEGWTALMQSTLQSHLPGSSWSVAIHSGRTTWLLGVTTNTINLSPEADEDEPASYRVVKTPSVLSLTMEPAGHGTVEALYLSVMSKESVINSGSINTAQSLSETEKKDANLSNTNREVSESDSLQVIPVANLEGIPSGMAPVTDKLSQSKNDLPEQTSPESRCQNLLRCICLCVHTQNQEILLDLLDNERVGSSYMLPLPRPKVGSAELPQINFECPAECLTTPDLKCAPGVLGCPMLWEFKVHQERKQEAFDAAAALASSTLRPFKVQECADVFVVRDKMGVSYLHLLVLPAECGHWDLFTRAYGLRPPDSVTVSGLKASIENKCKAISIQNISAQATRNQLIRIARPKVKLLTQSSANSSEPNVKKQLLIPCVVPSDILMKTVTTALEHAMTTVIMEENADDKLLQSEGVVDKAAKENDGGNTIKSNVDADTNSLQASQTHSIINSSSQSSTPHSECEGFIFVRTVDRSATSGNTSTQRQASRAKLIPASSALHSSLTTQRSASVLPAGQSSGSMAFVKFQFLEADSDLSKTIQNPDLNSSSGYVSIVDALSQVVTVDDDGMEDQSPSAENYHHLGLKLWLHGGCPADEPLAHVASTVRGALCQAVLQKASAQLLDRPLLPCESWLDHALQFSKQCQESIQTHASAPAQSFRIVLKRPVASYVLVSISQSIVPLLQEAGGRESSVLVAVQRPSVTPLAHADQKGHADSNTTTCEESAKVNGNSFAEGISRTEEQTVTVSREWSSVESLATLLDSFASDGSSLISQALRAAGADSWRIVLICDLKQVAEGASIIVLISRNMVEISGVGPSQISWLAADIRRACLWHMAREGLLTAVAAQKSGIPLGGGVAPDEADAIIDWLNNSLQPRSLSRPGREVSESVRDMDLPLNEEGLWRLLDPRKAVDKPQTLPVTPPKGRRAGLSGSTNDSTTDSLSEIGMENTDAGKNAPTQLHPLLLDRMAVALPYSMHESLASTPWGTIGDPVQRQGMHFFHVAAKPSGLPSSSASPVRSGGITSK